MTKTRVVLFVAALACTLWTGRASGHQDAGITVKVTGFQQSQAWFKRVRAHEIGQVDASAKEAATWPAETLHEIAVELHAIHQLLDLAASKGDTRIGLPDGRSLSLNQLAPLMGFTADELDLPLIRTWLADPDNASRRAISRIMTRGALLHTLVAMQDVEDVVATGPPVPRTLSRIGPAVGATRIRDGRPTRIEDRSAHWAIAREAFDMVGPPRAGSAVARTWYFATASYMQHQRNYSSLQPHLAHAREVMPRDARMFLFSGAACENLAAPKIQAAAEGDGATTGLSAPGDLLKQAEQYFDRALELDPDLAVARLRLARVMDETGRHAEAAVLLRQAEPALIDARVRYLAALFLGQAEESQAHEADARAAYERAIDLVPQAQSPRLALAAIASRTDRRDEAGGALRALLAGANPSDVLADPWWTYDTSHVGDVAALFATMFHLATEAVR